MISVETNTVSNIIEKYISTHKSVQNIRVSKKEKHILSKSH